MCGILFPERIKCLLIHSYPLHLQFVYNGISFLNEEQEKRVQQELRDGQLFRLVERALSFDDEHSVQALCSQVSLWLQGGEPAQPVDEAAEKSIVLEVPKSTQSSQCIAYVLHHELRRRFARVWTYPEKGNVSTSIVPFQKFSLYLRLCP